jgi:hypothetical protein
MQGAELVAADIARRSAERRDLAIEGIERMTKFQVGDVVTRAGDDRQKILEINDGGDLIHVECIKEPMGFLTVHGTRRDPWCRLGDREWNMASRYSYPDDLLIEAFSPLTATTRLGRIFNV